MDERPPAVVAMATSRGRDDLAVHLDLHLGGWDAHFAAACRLDDLDLCLGQPHATLWVTAPTTAADGYRDDVVAPDGAL